MQTTQDNDDLYTLANDVIKKIYKYICNYYRGILFDKRTSITYKI